MNLLIVSLIGKDKLYKVKLPNFIQGNYAIHDENNKKLINIEGKNENWQIASNQNAKILNPKKSNKESEEIMDKAILKEYSIYYILFQHSM